MSICSLIVPHSIFKPADDTQNLIELLMYTLILASDMRKLLITFIFTSPATKPLNEMNHTENINNKLLDFFICYT